MTNHEPNGVAPVSAPFILAYRAPEQPQDIRLLMGGAGSDVVVMSAAAWKLRRMADELPVVALAPAAGPGLVVGTQEFPGTWTLVLVQIGDGDALTVESGGGVPPSAVFLVAAAKLLDTMAGFTLGQRLAQQAQKQAATQAIAIPGRSPGIRA